VHGMTFPELCYTMNRPNMGFGYSLAPFGGNE